MPRKTHFYTLNPIDWVEFEKEWPEYDLREEAYLYLAIPPEVRYGYRNDLIRYWNEDFPNSLTTRQPLAEYPKQEVKPTKSKLDINNFHKPPTTRPRLPLPPIFFTTRGTPSPVKVTVVTSEPEADSKGSSSTNLLVIIGCLFLLINIFVFAGLYYKCVRLKNKEKKRREEYEAAAALGHLTQKMPDESSVLDGCNLMRMISKSTKSEDMYEAVKVSDDGSNTRFKLMRQVSASTIDPHTKVRDWIAQEIVQRCSPRFLRKTKQQLAEEQKASQEKQSDVDKSDKNIVEIGTIGSNSTLGQSPTRPVSPEEKVVIAEGKTIQQSKECAITSSAIPLLKPIILKKPEKISVAIDATPTGRGSSIVRQQPIELMKSINYEDEPTLRRSLTMDDVVNLPNESDNLRRSTASINLKFPSNAGIKDGLKISHSHSKSDPVQSSSTLPKKLKTFEPDVNVTCTNESKDKIQPLTHEQQLQTIKRRNFPKVLPDFPSTKEMLANKRRSMPAPGYLNIPIPEICSFSQPTSPLGKMNAKLPPAPPPRISSTLNRKGNNFPRVCQTAAALAEEPPSPTEPEITFNNLYIGPLLPVNHHKKSESASDLYKQSIQQIYEHLKPSRSQEHSLERREPKTIISADCHQPLKRGEPKVVIKPTISKKPADVGAVKAGARVVARNSSEEKYDIGKLSQPIPNSVKTDDDGKENPDGVKIIGTKVKLQKASQIPTFSKAVSASPPKKESSSSESTPSEESDTGTVVKRV